MSCDCCKRYLDHLDGKMKCFLSHGNSNSKHGMTIIQIFHPPCCEKDHSCCAGTKSTSNVQKGSANSVPTLSSSDDDRATQSSASERSRSQRGGHHRKTATSSQYEESGEDDSLSGYESIQSEHVKEFSELNYVLSGRCYLTAEQEEEIAALVKRIQPEIPVLVAQMKKSNVKRVNPNLVISKGYAAEHFPQDSENITLERPGGKEWPDVRLHVRPDRRGYMLCSKWPNFVRDNRLKEDDICLFEPIRGGKSFRLMVHLLRDVSRRTASPGGHGHGRAHVKREVAPTEHHVHQKSGREDSRSLNRHERRVVQEHHVVLSDSGGPSKPPLYVVLGGTCLTPAQEKIVQEKVLAMKPQVSIFVAAMTKDMAGCNDPFVQDLGGAAAYVPDGKQALTLRRRGRAWRTNLHNRLMLATGEWHEFARDSRLEEGDLCLLEPLLEERLAMAVHIIRSKRYSQ